MLLEEVVCISVQVVQYIFSSELINLPLAFNLDVKSLRPDYQLLKDSVALAFTEIQSSVCGLCEEC